MVSELELALEIPNPKLFPFNSQMSSWLGLYFQSLIYLRLSWTNLPWRNSQEKNEVQTKNIMTIWNKSCLYYTEGNNCPHNLKIKKTPTHTNKFYFLSYYKNRTCLLRIEKNVKITHKHITHRLASILLLFPLSFFNLCMAKKIILILKISNILKITLYVLKMV